MNYCHACRRHLNGALACAGCGTAAEYLIPAAPPAGRPAPPETPAVRPPVPETPTALADVYADSLVVLSAPEGRRAGARRRVAHRRRRRTVLSLGLGVLIAAGGSLSAAHLVADGQATDRASNVVLTDDGPQQPAPVPDLPTAGAPTGPGKGTAKTASVTRKAGTGSPSAGADAPGPSGPAPETGSDAGPAPTVSGSASVPPGRGPSLQASGSGTPSQGATGTSRAPEPVPPTRSPTPKPTKSCVLWIFCS
ncbi:hypothetical protein [Streptomyces sp. NPDC008265]|uniref:SCO2400 family protein n=1 Tax=Streptomyces sp. NPDC008265 TaxID=3364824 RepID=UPI0036E76E67